MFNFVVKNDKEYEYGSLTIMQNNVKIIKNFIPQIVKNSNYISFVETGYKLDLTKFETFINNIKNNIGDQLLFDITDGYERFVYDENKFILDLSFYDQNISVELNVENNKDELCEFLNNFLIN